MFTGAVTENRAIDILTQGAKDYVLKNRLHQRLVPAVQRTLAEAKEHRARKQAGSALREAHRTLEERVKTRTAELEAEITARKKTDEALLESEAVLRSFFDATGDMHGIVEVVAIDDVRHIAANVITANFCGLTPEMMRNRLGSELGASREVLLMWIGFYEESRRTQKPVSFEYEDRRNDKEAWLSATVSYLGINPDGEPRFAYTVRDISERKQAEAVVQRQAQLLDLSYDAIFAWHLNGPIEFWNRGAENLYGYNRDEAVGCVTHYLLQTQHPVPLDEIKEVLLRDGQWTGEVTHVTKDGRTIVVDTRHQLIGDAQGRQIVLEINRDVTEHKRAKEAADAAHRQVQGIIDNATALILCLRSGRSLCDGE